MDDDVSRQRIAEILLTRHGLRVQPEMGKYLLDQLRSSSRGTGMIPIIGGDARTGIAVRQLVAAKDMIDDLARATANE